jgi:hypothetical protein
MPRFHGSEIGGLGQASATTLAEFCRTKNLTNAMETKLIPRFDPDRLARSTDAHRKERRHILTFAHW